MGGVLFSADSVDPSTLKITWKHTEFSFSSQVSFWSTSENFATFLNINMQQKHRFEHTGVTEYYQPKQCTIFFGEILQICRNTFCCLFSFPGIPAGCHLFVDPGPTYTGCQGTNHQCMFPVPAFQEIFLDSTTRFAHTSDGSTFARHTNLVPFQCRACRIQNLNSNTSELLFLGEVLCFEFLDLK